MWGQLLAALLRAPLNYALSAGRQFEARKTLQAFQGLNHIGAKGFYISGTVFSGSSSHRVIRPLPIASQYTMATEKEKRKYAKRSLDHDLY